MNTPLDVLGRAGLVLRTLAGHEPKGATTSDLARQTGLARPTAHRLLSSLQQQGLVDRPHATGRWLLGPELYLLGAAAQPRYDITHLAQAHVRRLAEATGESAFFSARRGEETVCLIREDGSFPIRSHVLHEGIRFPLGVASAGLVILAYLSDQEVSAYLAQADLAVDFGVEHAADPLRRRLAQVRRDGWALNPGLLVEGSWGMGAAVFDADDRPAWALSLTGVERRFDTDRRSRLGELLLREAHALTTTIRRAHGQPARRA
ncbi:MAG: IclR family transcriptional regulator [Nocardioidaceae bacterium]|nr:IclR family transcriptional regulator [Nocardioidaceae bacterium]